MDCLSGAIHPIMTRRVSVRSFTFVSMCLILFWWPIIRTFIFCELFSVIIRFIFVYQRGGAKVGSATINQHGAIEGWPGLVRNRKHLPALSDRDFFRSAAGPVN